MTREKRVMNELELAKEEIRQLREYAEAVGRKYRGVAEAANAAFVTVGCGTVDEDVPPIPKRLIK